MIPLLPGPEFLPRLPELLSRDQEFAALHPITPELVAAVCRFGYMPMSLGAERPDILLVKCHAQRMVLELSDLHVPRNLPRYARGLTVEVDRHFSAVLGEIDRYHGESWISPPLAQALQVLHERPVHGVMVHSVEVCDPLAPEGSPPVAAEIGYSVGQVYTSLSGYHTRNGSGWVQMVALARLLERGTAAFWDLGMDIPYKRRLGARPVERKEFLRRYHRAAGSGEGSPNPLHEDGPRGPLPAHELVSRRP
ncbi:MAG: hypothetical protein ACOCU4_09655 [Alkalispirochaeta sp.]